MGMIYAWASPEYLLEHMTLRQIFYFYDQGISLLSGKPARNSMPQTPDLEGFNKLYGDVIKRPPKGG
jgi:hypothetical protein